MNQYPAVDYLDSISRLMKEVTSSEHQQLAGQVREIAATWREAEDLVSLGAYVKGSNPRIDRAVLKIEKLQQFFRQGIHEIAQQEESLAALTQILAD